MTRRELLSPLAAMPVRPAEELPRKLVKPSALQPGDIVGLITPATYTADLDVFMTAERTMKYFGLKPRFGRHVRRQGGYPGTIEQRLEDLHSMFADTEVKGIFPIRGGFDPSFSTESTTA